MQTVTVPMESLAEIIQLQLEKGGKATLTVTGSSMLPMLREHRDSVILVVPSQQKKGDIVLFRRENGRYILHRIISVTEDGYLCSGDNQAILESVSKEQIVAVVDGFTRKGRVYSLAEPGYRLYQAVWANLFFLRRPYIWVRRRLGRLYSRIRASRN